MAAVDGENDAVTHHGRPLTFRATGVPYQIGRGPERDGDPGSVTCPDRDRRGAEPHCVVAVRRTCGVCVARNVRGSGSLAGERRRRPADGHQQCRRQKTRFQQRSGEDAKHLQPSSGSGDSASQLRAICSRGISHSGCNDADAVLKRPAPEGQGSRLPTDYAGVAEVSRRPRIHLLSATRFVFRAVLGRIIADQPGQVYQGCSVRTLAIHRHERYT